ncbi:MAG: hypothetical protein ACE5GE_15585, partial [Phycisphaerae bacterium]
LDQRVHNVLEGADRRVDELHDLCRQVDTVAQMLKLEKGTAQETCKKVASLTNVLQQAHHRSAASVADAASTTECLVTAVTEAQSATNHIQRQLSSGLSDAQDKVDHLADAVAMAERACAAAQQKVSATQSACAQAVPWTEDLEQKRHQADATIERLTRALSDGKPVVEDIAQAQHAAAALRHETSAAQDACQRIAEVNGSLDANRHNAEATAAQVESATDNLRAMLADGQTALDAVHHRLQSTIGSCQEAMAEVDAKIEAAQRQGLDLQEGKEAAEQTANRVNEAARTLRDDVAHADEVIQTAHSAFDTLTRAIADGRCEARSIGLTVESVVAQADQTIASAAAQAEQVVERVQSQTAKLVSNGELATDAVRQRIETVISLADQESDKIERVRAAAAQAASALDERIASAVTSSTDLTEKIETTRELTQAGEQIGQQTAERIEAAGSVIDRLQDASTQADQLVESLAGATPSAQETLAGLTERLEQATSVHDRLNQTIADAGRAQQQCHHQVLTAGKAGTALTDMAKHAAAIAQQIEKARDFAQSGLAKLNEQREAARATLERQQIMRDKGLALLDQLQELTGSAQDVVGRLAQGSALAAETGDSLTQNIDRAAQSKFELDGRIQAADNRKVALQASEQTLADFLDQAEGLDQQIQRIQTRADAFEVRLNQMLDRPTQIATEAKAQAAQLQGVCRAVRKVFAGLSDAALQAKQRTDQFHQASRTADSQARRLAAETSQAAETLKRWVEEAVMVQSRLAASLEQSPSVERTHPATPLRSLSQLADKGMQRGHVLRQASQSTTPADRQRLPVNPEATDLTETADALLASRTGQTAPTAPLTTADARSRTEEVARLLEDARRVTETAQ